MADNNGSPRMKQDKLERKDKENTNAGMIVGGIFVILAIIGLYLFYTYEVQPPQVELAPTAAPAAMAPVTTAPAAEQSTTTAVPAPATAPATSQQ